MNGRAASRCAALCSRKRSSMRSARRVSRTRRSASSTAILAFATQAVYEQAFFHLLNTLQRRNGHTAVALAGGCAT